MWRREQHKMFPIKMKMNYSSGSPIVTLLLYVSVNLCCTDGSLSTKGCLGPAAGGPAWTHHIPVWELCVLYITLCHKKLQREEGAHVDSTHQEGLMHWNYCTCIIQAMLCLKKCFIVELWIPWGFQKLFSFHFFFSQDQKRRMLLSH